MLEMDNFLESEIARDTASSGETGGGLVDRRSRRGSSRPETDFRGELCRLPVAPGSTLSDVERSSFRGGIWSPKELPRERAPFPLGEPVTGVIVPVVCQHCVNRNPTLEPYRSPWIHSHRPLTMSRLPSDLHGHSLQQVTELYLGPGPAVLVMMEGRESTASGCSLARLTVTSEARLEHHL